MLLFQLEMIGGPCDGWRVALAATPGRVLRVRFQLDALEVLTSGDVPAGNFAEYRFRDVAALSSDGPQVTLRYDFRQYLPNGASATPYNHCQTQGQANAPAAPSFWRRLLVSSRRWLLAPVGYPGCVRGLQ
jgi:hypothetical protein